MSKETMYWNHYKTNQSLKDTFIFFHTAGFFKTYESDAVVLSQLFGFKINLQEGLKTAAFSENSLTYLERLKDSGYSYAVLELNDDGNISVLHRNIGDKPIELNVPLDTFLGFLSDIQSIHDKYETSLRMIQSIDLPIGLNEKLPKQKITDIFFPNQKEGNNIKLSKLNQNNSKEKNKELEPLLIS